MGIFDIFKPREDFTLEIRRAAFERCRGKCSNPKCGIKLKWKNFKGDAPTHFDHKDGKPYNASLENCNPLCANCHAEKSNNENTKRAKKSKNKFSSINEEMGKLFNIDDYISNVDYTYYDEPETKKKKKKSKKKNDLFGWDEWDNFLSGY